MVPSITTSTEQNMSKDSVLASDSWLDGWSKRRIVNITGSVGAGINYQVNVTISDGALPMQQNYGDVRFTAIDGVTLLDYWLEDWALNYNPAYFWVNVTDNLDSNQTIYQYWGTDEATTTTSNGTATFLFYEDWSSQTIDAGRWNTINNDGTISYDDTDADHGYVMKMDVTSANLFYQIQSTANSTAPTALMFRSLLELSTTTNQRIRQGMSDVGLSAFAVVASNYGTQEFMIMDDDTNFDYQSMSDTYFDSYFTFQITRDGTDAKLYADYSLIETGSCAPDAVETNSALLYIQDSEKDLYSDWIASRKFVAVEPTVSGFGDEETYTPPTEEWKGVGETTVYFHVPFDYWAFDMILIFLGLGMIILGSLYGAYKIRNDPDMDTVIIVLLLFMFGCALFLGGIGFVGGV